MMGFDIETGDMLWSHEQDNYPPDKRNPGYGDTHANTVIYDHGAIYYAAGDGNCGVKLTLSDDGSQLTEVWRNKGFDSYMGGIIKLGSQLYGSGTAKPQLVAIDSKTGILTDTLAIGRGTIVVADSMIYYYNQQGMVHLVSYDTGKLASVSSFRITKGSREHFSHPLIHKGVMYIRHGHVIMGYAI
jgi:outer membrane protein assembly factor BamB